MQKMISKFVHDIYDGMDYKLKLIWPKKDDFWPPEANVIFEIARLSKEYRFLVYGEANVGNRSRRDMILLNMEDRWICQVEVKLVNSDTIKAHSVIADLERVKDNQALTGFIENFRKNQRIGKMRGQFSETVFYRLEPPVPAASFSSDKSGLYKLLECFFSIFKRSFTAD